MRRSEVFGLWEQFLDAFLLWVISSVDLTSAPSKAALRRANFNLGIGKTPVLLVNIFSLLVGESHALLPCRVKILTLRVQQRYLLQYIRRFRVLLSLHLYRLILNICVNITNTVFYRMRFLVNEIIVKVFSLGKLANLITKRDFTLKLTWFFFWRATLILSERVYFDFVSCA